MKTELFTYALKDGNYVSIDTFKSGDGEKCGCICPACGEKVRSNISAKERRQLKRNFTNHFSHVDETTKCLGGYKDTQLHLFAKDVLLNSSEIKVPSKQYHYPDTLKYSEVKLEPAFPIERFKQYRPDIILVTDDSKHIAVEIVVTNNLSDQKTRLYREYKIKCISIDLSVYYKSDLEILKNEIEIAILKDVDKKKWIWPEIENELSQNEKINSTSGNGCSIVLLIIIIFTFLLLLN